MNTTDTIIAATVVAAGSTLIRNAHEGKSHAAPIVFGFMMATGLLLISMASPGTAKGLSYMAMIGAFAVNGPAVFSLAGNISKSPSPGITGGPAKPLPHGIANPVNPS